MKIGQYEVIELLGKGGMGEVWLVHDPVCERKLALKRIRQDLRFSQAVHGRFLREAKIAALLSHPSIIPVYEIHNDGKNSFYTMPYVEGETLKEILQKTRLDPQFPAGSIASLMRIFLHICQAIAHAHSKNILHRDLKAENVIIGKHGEVIILDWGLANYIQDSNAEPKKVDGTLTYMAPERAFGMGASPLTDVYALGVLLYQLLTLKLPFRRTSLEQFRKTAERERLQDPNEAAPYRDIPASLVQTVRQCLAQDPEKRVSSAAHLIELLANYIEGRPEWIPTASLLINKKNDWEFQEHILLAKHIALSGKTDLMEWVSMMVSKMSFSGNLKITARMKLDFEGAGIGFLLDIPSTPFRKSLEEGYCIWLAPYSCSLFRSNVEILTRTHIHSLKEKWHTVCIKKIDRKLYFLLDDAPIFEYTSYLPTRGEHIGILQRDTNFNLEALSVSLGSQNVHVSCLAVPDAFLAHRQFGKALTEYRRIHRCFPGRAEGREALFRSGITLLEAGYNLNEALDAFGALRGTPGAPLEYLGKALVYQASSDTEEEIKCLELALRKYIKHPRLSTLVEHIAFRLHETSCKDRSAAYQFALLTLRHLPHLFEKPDHMKLLETLQTYIPPLYFTSHLDIQIAFWLAKPLALLEIADSAKDPERAASALLALLELGFFSWVKERTQNPEIADLIAFQEKKVPFASLSTRAQIYSLKKDFSLFKSNPNISQDALSQDILNIHMHLQHKNWTQASALLEKYPLEERTKETSPLYPLFGCFLWITEGKEIALHHFTTGTELAFPPPTALLGYYLKGRICLKKGWITKAFFEEKMTLLRQLQLFFQCTEDPKMHAQITKKAKVLQRALIQSYPKQ